MTLLHAEVAYRY